MKMKITNRDLRYMVTEVINRMIRENNEMPNQNAFTKEEVNELLSMVGDIYDEYKFYHGGILQDFAELINYLNDSEKFENPETCKEFAREFAKSIENLKMASFDLQERLPYKAIGMRYADDECYAIEMVYKTFVSMAENHGWDKFLN